MFFQNNNTPVKLRAKKQDLQSKDDEEENELVLAPFCANPKLCFDNVTVGTSVKKTLWVKNPNSHDIQVFVTKAPPQERRFMLSWSECMVPCKEAIKLEMSWYPEVEGGWRDLLIFEDGVRLKKDVAVTFRSVTQRKSNAKNNKVISSKVKPPSKRVSKKLHDQKSKTQRSPLKSIVQIPIIKIETPQRRGTYTIRDKENFQFPSFAGCNNASTPETERNTKNPVETVDNINKFYDSLEQSFEISENLTPVNSNKFMPKVCLMESEPMKTGDSVPTTSDLAINSTSYVKEHNISTETYIVGNNSTYIKDDSLDIVTSTTYTKRVSPASSGKLRNSTTSALRMQNLSGEGVKNITEANLWCTGTTNTRTNLKLIAEESFVPISSDTDEHFIRSLRKRKSDCNLQTSPLKYQIRQTEVKQEPFTFHDSNKYLSSHESPQFYEFQTTYEQEERFVKWLNALLRPPEELSSNTEREIDVAKLWQQCNQREVLATSTKEIISAKYHVNKRLDALRVSAMNLLRTAEMSSVLTRAFLYIEENKLVIRTDRNLHLDLGLQQEIMLLFLSYNPLWLRIGLETAFKVTIPLKSNSDVVGLSSFIVRNLFRNAALLKRYRSALSPQYAIEIKKFILKKFLTLVYFLDQAKIKRLIPHDPCLFCKNAPIKQSCDILLTFARFTLSAIGDVTKVLRPTGYILVHQQTYIHEFDYTVSNLDYDLRDGVRLTRTVEIILSVSGLTSSLRVPAISRLQKIHNMKIVFGALNDAGFEILYDVVPKDIVDGHKQKTFSFLWQIIYKFQGRRISKATGTIQRWWRSLQIILKRRVLTRNFNQRQAAASKIQKWYRNIKFSAKLNRFSEYFEFNKRLKAAVKIQSFYRMLLARKAYLKKRKLIVSIQSYARRWLIMLQIRQKLRSIIKIQSIIRMYMVRKRYLKLKHTVLKIEQRYAAIKLMVKQRAAYNQLKTAVVLVQRRFRSSQRTKQEKSRFILLKKRTVQIQQRFRANKQMKIEKTRYIKLRETVLCIQTRFRTNKLMKADRAYFLRLRESVLLIQRYFRANKAMQIQRKLYVQTKESVSAIQRRFRALKTMKIQRHRYAVLKKYTLLMQQRFRANRLMKSERAYFLRLNESVLLIQRRFRAKKAMQLQQKLYIQTRESVVLIQRRFRELKIMKMQRQRYLVLKKYASLMQQRFRANKLMKFERAYFLRLKESVLLIQRRFRAKKATQLQEKLYIQTRESALLIQRRFREFKTMKMQRQRYLGLKKYASLIQQRFRANKLMKFERAYFLRLKESVLLVQRRFRATRTMHLQQKFYIQTRESALVIQRRFRELKTMKMQRQKYLALKKYASLIQQRFRANKLMKFERAYFLRLKESVLFVQRRFRATRTMHLQQKLFIQTRESALVIQRRFREFKTMKMQRQRYLVLKKYASLIQQRFRANKLMKFERTYFLRLKESVLLIQRRFRAKKATQLQQKLYIQTRESALLIQRRFREFKTMKMQRQRYLVLKKYASLIQQRFRANKLMKFERTYFLRLKESVLLIQRRFRAKKATQLQQKLYIQTRESALLIQRRFREFKTMKMQRQRYLVLKKYASLIQQRFRANKLMKFERAYFLRLKQSVLLIQRRFRANKAMQIQRKLYIQLKESAIVIQRRFRAFNTMKRQREIYIKQKSTVIFIQRWYRWLKYFQRLKTAVVLVQSQYRAARAMRVERERYLALRNAAIFVQTRFRQKKLKAADKKCNEKLLKAVLFVQSRFRANRLVKLEKIREERLRNSAATKIQAVWRGYRTRSMEETHITNLRNKVEAANKRSHPENTIGYRSTQAKLILTLSYNSLKLIIEALQTIESSTTVSEVICLSMSICISHELYKFMKSTCRSLPDITACTLSTSILINFYKYTPSRVNCWNAAYISDVFSIMGYSCDKEGLLFPYLCTLVWLFAHNDEYKKVILKIPKLKPRILKIQQLCKRKQEMVLRTPTRFQSTFVPYTNLPLPCLEPDWGIINPDRPRTFTNSVHALNCVLDILGQT